MHFHVNGFDRIREERLPVVRHGGCSNGSGVAIFIIEDGMSSLYHVLFDYVFAAFATLDWLGLVPNATVIIMDGNNYRRNRVAVYDQVFQYTFGRAPVRNHQVEGCFSDVVVGTFLNRVMVPELTFAHVLQYAPELQTPLARYRTHLLSQLGVTPRMADTVVIAQRPVKDGRYLANEQQFLRTCETTSYQCILVDLAQLSFREQVRLVAHAAVLVGVEGAAMALTFFGPPNQTVIQIRHPKFLNRFHSTLMLYLERRVSVEWPGVLSQGVVANPYMLSFVLTHRLTPTKITRALEEVAIESWTATFERYMMERAATPLRQILFTTGWHYLHWWQHLTAYLTFTHRLRNTLFIAEDLVECLALWEIGALCFQNSEALALDLDVSLFPRSVVAKHFYMLKFLEAGFHTLFTDADVVFLRDPFQLFQEVPFQLFEEVPFQGLSDYLETQTECHNHKSGTCMSTGLMVATPVALPLWRAVVNALIAAPGVWEQEMFNRVLPAFPHAYLTAAANCRVFRHAAVTRGLATVLDQMVVIHLGWVKREDKQLVLQKLGLYRGDTPWGEVSGLAFQFDPTVCRPDGIWSLP
jgi:hypothetical protein